MIAGVAATQTRTSAPAPPALQAAQRELVESFAGADDGVAAGQGTGAPALPQGLAHLAPAPLPDGRRAQDYAASLRLAVGSVADLSRSTQSVLDTVHSLGGAVVTVDYGTPSAGSGSALIDLRVPVGRAQEALRSFSALGTITAQQVQIRDLQAGLDRETNRARALRHRVELLQAKLLSPSLTSVERATLEAVWPIPGRRSRASCAGCTRPSSAPHPPASRSLSSRVAARRSRRPLSRAASSARRTTHWA